MTAKSPAQRKAAERQRKAEAGIVEVRGIYSHAGDADEVRTKARELAAKLQRKREKR